MKGEMKGEEGEKREKEGVVPHPKQKSGCATVLVLCSCVIILHTLKYQIMVYVYVGKHCFNGHFVYEPGTARSP